MEIAAGVLTAPIGMYVPCVGATTQFSIAYQIDGLQTTWPRDHSLLSGRQVHSQDPKQAR